MSHLPVPLPRFASKTSQQQTKIPLPCVLVASVAVQIVAASKSTHSHNIYCATDKRGTRTAKLNAEAGTCEAHLRPWYKEAVAPNKPIWTSIYPGFTPSRDCFYGCEPTDSRSKW
ncbi:hypothetical protein QUB70_24710 [Microcoleus sp. A003_D6]|uniref:hypothetical protein n=1 Tax=Microcoleus sp. A003_D6 TaxID=3055266 RepID=UPI002FCEA3D1